MRLIDADVMLEHLREDPLFPFVEKYGMSGVIESMPTVDAVPVIRCRDCKYNSNTDGNYVKCNIIPQMFGKTPDDNYCSWAERKEE